MMRTRSPRRRTASPTAGLIPTARERPPQPGRPVCSAEVVDEPDLRPQRLTVRADRRLDDPEQADDARGGGRDRAGVHELTDDPESIREDAPGSAPSDEDRPRDGDG